MKKSIFSLTGFLLFAFSLLLFPGSSQANVCRLERIDGPYYENLFPNDCQSYDQGGDHGLKSCGESYGTDGSVVGDEVINVKDLATFASYEQCIDGPYRHGGNQCYYYVAQGDANCSTPPNNPPNPPNINGPTSGAPNTNHEFSFQATDPDGDTIQYEVDWNDDGAPDQTLPGTGFVPSGSVEYEDFSWATPNSYTFRARTQDSIGENSIWAYYSITINTPPVAPTANLQINGSDGPLDVPLGSNLALSWTSTNTTSCVGYGAGWGFGNPIILNGTANITANQGDTYVIQCSGPGGPVTDSVEVRLSNSLKLCQNSCSSGVMRGSSSGAGSFTLAQGGSQNLAACFNPVSDCSSNNGDVTSSASWSEGGGSVISLSGTDPKTVTGDNVGTESVTASYSGQNATSNVTVACVPTVTCGNAPGRENYCENQNFQVDNGCGTSITCSGVKSCDFNWKEVAP